MQSFTVVSCRWRGVAMLVTLGGFGAVLVFSSIWQPVMLIPMAGWALLTWGILLNAVRSLISDEVEISWDGRRLVVGPMPGQPKLELESAKWVFSDGSNIVIGGGQPMPKFNSGHVRSNGQEMTVDGFLGSTPVGLRDTIQKLGPKKTWLWRYMPI